MGCTSSCLHQNQFSVIDSNQNKFYDYCANQEPRLLPDPRHWFIQDRLVLKTKYMLMTRCKKAYGRNLLLNEYIHLHLCSDVYNPYTCK